MATLAQARLKACQLWPYGSHSILSLVPVKSQSVDLICVDQHWRLYYRPSELEKLSADEAAGAVLHELSHLLLKHHKRAETVVPAGATRADWYRWNVAADLAVNHNLAAEGITLPDGSVFPGQYKFDGGLPAERYYRLLEEREQDEQRRRQQEQQPEPQPEQQTKQQEQADPQPEQQDDEQAEAPPDEQDQDEQSQPGDEQGDDQAKSEPDDQGQSEQGQPGDEQGDQGDAGDGQDAAGDGPSEADGDQGQPDDGQSDDGQDGQQGDQPRDTDGQPGQSEGQPGEPGDSDEPPLPGGSCSDGQQRPWELPPPDDCDTPGIKPHEAEILLREVAEKIADKAAGKGAGGWRAWAQDVLVPKVDPRAKLLRAVRKAVEFASGAGDYSYRRPNRRNPQPEIVRPSAVQPIPRVTVIVDTSGSMEQRDLGLSLGLIGKVLNGFRIRDGVRVLCGDAAVQSAGRVFSPKQVELVGGGGTDMGVLIVAAAQAKPRPELIVVCTDGYTPWPAEPVGVPVVACVTRPEPLDDVPKWIETVALN